MAFFGDNTQDVSGLPVDDTMMQLELKRRLDMAKALQQQEMPQGQMVSGHYVAPHWTQQLAALGNQIVGRKQEENAMKQYGQFQQAKQAKLADLLAGKEVQSPMDYNESGNMPGMTQTTRQPYSQQEFMAKAVGAMPDLAPELVKNQLAQYGKEDTPISLGEGGILVNRKGETIASNPKAAKEEASPFSKINPLEATPESLAKYLETKNPADLRSAKPAPAPVTRNMRQGTQEITQQWDPAKNTWTTIAQGSAFKPESAPKLKEVPPTQRGAYIGNNSSIAQIDATLEKLDAAPDAWFGIKGGMGDKFMQTAYPESNDIRAAIGGVSSIKRHDISGAAVSPSEDRKLAQYIPNPTDDKKAIRDKLVNFKNELMRSNQAIQGSYGDEYSPLPKQQQASQPKSTMPAPRLGSGKINESSLKAGVVYDLGGGKSGAWNPKTRSFE